MPITSVSRPTYRVAGLLTEKPEILAISGELASAGADAAAMEILCGESGAAIWMSMAAATGCEAGSCGPFSGSIHS
jgi:hypothetical protein